MLEPIKALIAASSGYGKTGMLWSLVQAGFKLRIYDADRGTKIIRSACRASNCEAQYDKLVEIETFTNKLRASGGYPVPKGKPTAWSDALAAMDKWPGPSGGSVYDWGPDTVVVIDSLTMFGRHALLLAQHMENKTGKQPEIQHYGTAMTQIEGMMALLYGEDVNCHVLVLTHVSVERTKEGEFIGAFPSSLGKGLNDVIPRYFNDILSVKMSGMGPSAKRYLSTRPTSNQIATKVAELSTKPEYLLTNGVDPKPGLAEFFADCGWSKPNVQ